MRKKFKTWTVLCVIGAFALFTGCSLVKYQYSFDQPYSNVIKMEVCQYHYATKREDTYITPVAELDLEKAEELLRDISELACYKHFGDSSMNYGDIVLYITYSNGEAEVLGMVNSASVDTNGKWWMKVYYFDSTQWCAVLTKYVDPELVPELGRYLE